MKGEGRAISIEIVFETHSTSIDNERGIATGWLDGRLSEMGRRQAKELGKRRRGEDIAAVFTSDLGRAVETAEIAFGRSGIPIHRDARLRECNYGALNGVPAARVAAEQSRRVDEPFPDGESYRQVVERVRSFLDELSPAFDGAHVVVIGHAAPRWALDYLLRGIALEDLVAGPFQWQPGWLYVFAGEATGNVRGMMEREDERTPEEAIRDIREKGKPDADEREFLDSEGVRLEPDEEDKAGRPLD